MADVELDHIWSAAFPDRSRPQLYSTKTSEERYKSLNDVDDFLVDSLQSLTPAQLYALTANNYEVLVALQEEHTALEKIASKLKNRDFVTTSVKDPQELPRHEVFEERKEAALYDYKYDANRRMLPARFTVSENVTEQEKYDCREPQEPFAQGGLIPNDKQYRSLMATAKAEGREKNPDNQKSYTQNFAFQARPPGNWIVKMLQPEAPPPPRTRAREAALVGITVAAGHPERSTRYQGEKVPTTRDISLAPSEAASPAKRVATPATDASPAPKRRKIETVDVTNGLPKKKHANQYTKRREIEMAGQLAAAQEFARIHGLPIPEHYTQLEAISARGSPMPTKKKHPNQYTKRREREEAERLAREEDEKERRAQAAPPPPLPPPPAPSSYSYGWPERGNLPPPPTMPSYQAPNISRYGSSLPYDPVHSARQTIAPLGPPNPYSLNRETVDRAGFLPQPQRFPSFWNHQPVQRDAEPRYPHYNQPPPDWKAPSQPIAAAPTQGPPPEAKASRGKSPAVNNTPKPVRDTSHMTPDEKRHFVFKDHELIQELERDHSWLHDDPIKAAAWKLKIQSSDYPVRTWAMLRKWREWRAEGKDKRPRDKDGNRIRDPAFSPGMNGTPPLDEDVDMADVESATASQTASQLAPAAVPSPTPTGTDPAIRALSPLRTSSRLRTRIGLESPVMPSSPLVNGISAQDLVQENKNTPSLSFSKLQDVGELDSTAKVDTWQEKTQTDYAASTVAGKGVLRQHPRLRDKGTEDELYSSSPDVDHELDIEAEGDVEMKTERPDQQDVESEDPLHGSIDSDSHPSSPSTDPGERDTTYRSGARTRRRVGQPMRRTRSGLSNVSAAPRSKNNTRKSSSKTAGSEEADDPITSPAMRRTRKNAVKLEFDDSSEDATSEGSEIVVAASPVIGKRSLRPNPPKRTLTVDSEVSTSVGTRRSMRNTAKVDG